MDVFETKLHKVTLWMKLTQRIMRRRKEILESHNLEDRSALLEKGEELAIDVAQKLKFWAESLVG